MFIRAPVQGYMDSARRAEMTDIADTALRRMARDIRTAVPNSVRIPVAAGSTYIEFLPTKAGGRYRANPDPAGAVQCGGTRAQDILDFTIADSCFEIIGTAIPFVRGATDDTSDQIVVGSTQSNGNPAYDKTFAGPGVRRPYTGVTGTLTKVQILGVQFPAFAELSSQHFDVVPNDQQAVTYACVGTLGTLDANNDGQAQLMRYWNYGFINAQPVPPLGVPNAMLANRVSTCNIVYNLANQRNGLVAITLVITRGGESVSLYQEIHVNNIP
jgi:MSHA biogenesis protein MshO